MMRIGIIGLIVCWPAAFALGQADSWKVKTDPTAPKAVAAVEARVADLAVPASFFAADVTFADQFGPFVATGRNGAPQESRAVYDLRTGEKVAELKGKHDGERPSALSLNGMILALGGGPFNAQTIHVYNLKTGEKLREIRSDKKAEQLQFIDNDRLLTVSDWDHLYTVWDVATGKELKKFAQGREARGRPAVSPGGSYLALAEGDKVRIFSIKSGEEAGSLDVPNLPPFGLKCMALGFSPDGARLGGLFEHFQKHRVLVWDMTNGKETGSYELERLRNPFYDGVKFQWSPDGLGWMVNGEEVHDGASGQLLWKVPEKRGRSHLVAINQAVSLTEAGRTRTLTAHHLTKEQVAKMRELVKAGGSSNDALLPPLTEANLAEAKRITVPLAADAWTYKPEAAADAGKLAARPFKLAVNANEVASLHIAPAASLLAVEVQPADSPAFQPHKQAVAVERYDLATGKRLERFAVPAPVRLAGVDAACKHGLFLDAEKGQRLDVWSLTDTSKHVAGWRPYAAEEEKNRAVTFAALVDGQRVLTSNAASKLILWSLPACKAEYVAEVPSLSHLRLTGNGKVLAGLDTDRVRCFDTATGQPIGDTAAASPAAGTREARALAVRPDGAEAAAVFHVPANAAAPWLAVRWDLAKGKVVDSFSFQAGVFPGPAVVLAYAGNGHLLLENSQLIDLERKEVVWTYRLPFGGKAAAQPPDGRIWYTAADLPAQPTTLVAATVPEEAALRLLKLAVTAPDAIIKPGTAFAIQTDAAGEQAARIQAGLRSNAQESLKRLGLAAGDTADLRLTLKVSERSTGESVEFRKLFPKFGENRFGTTKVQLMEVDCQATLTQDGKTLWQSPKERFGMRTLGILRLPRDETDVGRYLRTRMWDNAQAWASRLNPPRHLVRTADGLLALPGTSALGVSGPAPLPLEK